MNYNKVNSVNKINRRVYGSQNQSLCPGGRLYPSFLAGRTELLEKAEIALHRVARGRPEKSFVAVGLRGVGKTVILNRIAEMAEKTSYEIAEIEATEDNSFEGKLVAELRRILIEQSFKTKLIDNVQRAMGVLQSFASTIKIEMGEFNLRVEPVHGRGDSGDLSIDLADLFIEIGTLLKANGSALAIIVDEVQYLDDKILKSLIHALHRCASKSLPVIFFGAGLPQIQGKMGEAKTYAERLFDFSLVGPLSKRPAEEAIIKPAKEEGVFFNQDSLEELYRITAGYPYFLQEWGKAVWNIAPKSPITVEDVRQATEHALKTLDIGFFRVRLDRTTPKERLYMRALAELGNGSHRSSEVAALLNKEPSQIAPLRARLINKDMIYSPGHSDTAFTVPLFDDFLRREIPGNTPLDWNL